MFRYYLLVLLSIFVYAESSELLTLQENRFFTLNTSTINHLKYLDSVTLTIDNQEIDYHATSYEVSSNSAIHWEGKNKAYQSNFSFTLLHNAVRGSIALNQEKYILALTPHSSTEYQITKVDPTKENKICQKKSYKTTHTLKKQKSSKESTQASSTALPIAALEVTTEINVLILYTQQLKDYYGNNTDLTIQHYFDKASTIYNDSQTNVHLNLVHTELTSNNSFSEDNNISSALINLQPDTDIRALKRKYNADIVSLFRKYDANSGVCGLGFLYNIIELTDYFYTVIEIKSADEGSGSYCADRTFAHEVGHNFGCAHDRDNASVHPDNDYGYGYDIDGEFATVMSYKKSPIPYFSNPNLRHNGIDIGVDNEADCARNIREKRVYVKQNQILETGDQANNSNLSGSLSDKKDKDLFTYTLKGEVSFTLVNENSYYIHIYDSNGHLAKTSDSSFSHSFTDDTYSVVSSLTNADNNSSYVASDVSYSVDLTTSNGSIEFIRFTNKSEAFIERFYQNILGRTADTAGLNGWVNILQTQSASKVAIGFFHSTEFINLHLNNTDFIDILYRTLFDREADSTGKNIWLDLLNKGTSRDMVMSGFFNSQEFTNLAKRFHATAIRPIDQLVGLSGYVNRFYSLVLNRDADQAGFDFWTTALLNKTQAGGDIAKGFFKSNEYINRHLDNNTFIDICYKAFFDRVADSGGKSLWLDRLNQGASIDDILDGFIGSQEFINLSASFGIMP